MAPAVTKDFLGSARMIRVFFQQCIVKDSSRCSSYKTIITIPDDLNGDSVILKQYSKTALAHNSLKFTIPYTSPNTFLRNW